MHDWIAGQGSTAVAGQLGGRHAAFGQQGRCRPARQAAARLRPSRSVAGARLAALQRSWGVRGRDWQHHIEGATARGRQSVAGLCWNGNRTPLDHTTALPSCLGRRGWGRRHRQDAGGLPFFNRNPGRPSGTLPKIAPLLTVARRVGHDACREQRSMGLRMQSTGKRGK